MKKSFIWILCCSCVILSGCSSDDDIITRFYMEQIDTNGKYDEYLKLKEENSLDESGEYIDAQSQTDEEAVPAIAQTTTYRPLHIIFAENKAFDIEYYKDDKYTVNLFSKQEDNKYESQFVNRVQTREYDAELGEKIYAKIVKKENAIDLYEINSFRIINKGNDNVLANINVEKSGENTGVQYAEIKFGTNFNDGEECKLVVEPLGMFHMRTFTLMDNVIYSGGLIQNNAEGTEWKIDNDTVVNTTAISPERSYTVSYSFPSDVYYTDKSNCNPEPYLVNNEGGEDGKGTVEFYQVKSENEEKTEAYYVKLYPYTTIEMNDKKKKIVETSINGDNEDVRINYDEKGKNYNISKLKPDDNIVITLNDIKYKISSIDTYEKSESGYTFTYKVPEVKSADKTTITLGTEEWSDKEITISASEPDDKQFYEDFFKYLKDNNLAVNALDYLLGNTKTSPFDTVVTLEINGVKNSNYTYKDLKNGEKIQVYEPDKIKLSIAREMLGVGNVTITVNNEEEYIVDYNSDKYVFEFDFDQIESLDIKFSEKV